MTCNKSQFFLWRCFNIKQELPINGQIREKEVQLIGANGEKLGIISTREALDKAAEKISDEAIISKINALKDALDSSKDSGSTDVGTVKECVELLSF